MQRFQHVTVEQLMRGTQAAAAGAENSGGFIQEAARIESVKARIEEIQRESNTERDDASDKQQPAPLRRRRVQPGRNARRLGRKNVSRARHVAQWNCDFTSAFDKTTIAQMPIGKPMRQQGDVHGIIARMLAVMHRP